jgi:hypothetical protein
MVPVGFRRQHNETKKAGNVQTNNARRNRTPGERSTGAKNRRHQAGPNAHRNQMWKMRRAQSCLGRAGTDPGAVHVQGMRRGAEDVVSRRHCFFLPRGSVLVIARSDSDEAIHSGTQRLDCFAPARNDEKDGPSPHCQKASTPIPSRGAIAFRCGISRASTASARKRRSGAPSIRSVLPARRGAGRRQSPPFVL